MTKPASDNPRPGVSALHVEIGTNARRRVASFWIAPVIALFASGSATLFARLPHSSPPPGSVSVPLDQPHDEKAPIRWSPASVTQIISPGETATIPVAFASSQNIRRAAVQLSPALASFVSARPSFPERIRKDQPFRLDLVLNVRDSAQLGTFNGTVSLTRSDDDDGADPDSGNERRVLEQVLPIRLNIWARFTDATSGLSFAIPPQFVLSATSPISARSVYLSRGTEEFPGEGITVSREIGEVASVLSELDSDLTRVSTTTLSLGSTSWTLVIHLEQQSGLQFFTAVVQHGETVVAVGTRNTPDNVSTIQAILQTFVF